MLFTKSGTFLEQEDRSIKATHMNTIDNFFIEIQFELFQAINIQLKCMDHSKKSKSQEDSRPVRILSHRLSTADFIHVRASPDVQPGLKEVADAYTPSDIETKIGKQA